MPRATGGIGAWVAALAVATVLPAAEPPHFPSAPLIDAQAAFWTDVYGRWSLSQVALHDRQCPSLVYEVVDLPGAAGEAYTPQQKEFVEDVRLGWEARLADVETKVASSLPLSDGEKSLALAIGEACGTNGLTGASTRVRSQRGMRERFRRGLAVSARYDDRFRAIFREAGLPEDLALLPHVESSFQHTARSSAGAVGVWQFTRATGRKFLRVNAAVDERLDPVASARGAARYLSQAHDLLGSWPLALTSYNHGMAGMARARARFGDDFESIVRHYDAPTFGFASRNFYAEFLAAREVATHPQVYFPEGVAFEAPLAADDVPLPRSMTIHEVQSRYGVDRATLRRLNPAWSARASSGRIPLPAGHRVWLPDGTLSARRTAPEPEREPTTVATSRPASEKSRYHRVKPGDTLWSVAKRYGLELSELRRMNGLSPKASRIRPGQRLRVGHAS